jgi:hypothetical protein
MTLRILPMYTMNWNQLVSFEADRQEGGDAIPYGYFNMEWSSGVRVLLTTAMES